MEVKWWRKRRSVCNSGGGVIKAVGPIKVAAGWLLLNY